MNMVACDAITIDRYIIPLRGNPQPLSIGSALLGEFQEESFIMTPVGQVIGISLN